MNVEKNLSIKKIIQWSYPTILFILIYSGLILWGYENEYILIDLPIMPISLIGTAVAFYVGFKNNNAYDRLWEARKVWGAIVNSSRAWGTFVCGYITDMFVSGTISDQELHHLKTRLIHRHIAWLYTLRQQLLKPTQWEHSSQSGAIGKEARMFQRNFGVGLVEKEVREIKMSDLLPAEDLELLRTAKNKATQIINLQSEDLKQIRRRQIMDDFRHMEMMEVLYDFYNHQGKLERIKNFPLPRQYANMSNYFVYIFVLILPFSLIPELYKLGGHSAGFIALGLNLLISWVYLMMERVGDYSENPFQGMANDIPMLSLSRTIEIDLRQMLGETDLPEPIKSKNGILM